MKWLIVLLLTVTILAASPSCYAAGIEVSGLLAETNQHRTAPLAINAKLNAAAQAKAEDMVARNYWAHTAPSGTKPWDFLDRVGYKYDAAGENLAYAQLFSAEVVDNWMQSPGHRANMLSGAYTEVGFGIAQATNYLNEFGPVTITVAFYAKPTPPPAPRVKSAATPQPAPQPEPAPTPEPAPEPPKTPEPAKNPQESAKLEEKHPSNLTLGLFAVVLAAGLVTLNTVKRKGLKH